MESVFGVIFVAAVALVFLILAMGILYFLLQVLWFSIAAWMAACAVFAVVFFGVSLALRPNKTTLVRAVSLNPGNLAWELDGAAVAKAKNTILFSLIAGALAITTLVSVLFALHRAGRFDNVMWWWWFLTEPMTVWRQAAFVMAFILSFLIVGVAVVLIMAHAEDSNLRSTEQLVRVMNSDRGKADAYLKASARLAALVEELGIVLDRPYTEHPRVLSQAQTETCGTTLEDRTCD